MSKKDFQTEISEYLDSLPKEAKLPFNENGPEKDGEERDSIRTRKKKGDSIELFTIPTFWEIEDGNGFYPETRKYSIADSDKGKVFTVLDNEGITYGINGSVFDDRIKCLTSFISKCETILRTLKSDINFYTEQLNHLKPSHPKYRSIRQKYITELNKAKEVKNQITAWIKKAEDEI